MRKFGLAEPFAPPVQEKATHVSSRFQDLSDGWQLSDLGNEPVNQVAEQNDAQKRMLECLGRHLGQPEIGNLFGMAPAFNVIRSMAARTIESDYQLPRKLSTIVGGFAWLYGQGRILKAEKNRVE